MKTIRLTAAIIISLLMSLGITNRIIAQSPANTSDKEILLPANTNIIGGYIGSKIDLVIDKRIKAMDEDYLVEPFRHREETDRWQSEFWGKWVLSAIAAYDYKHDEALLKKISNSVKGILATQSQSGFIGNYTDKAQLTQWDIWGRKYTMLGLLAYYDLSSDKAALEGACKLADHLMTQVGPGKTNIVKTGNYHGMPSSSILEPVVQLYLRSGNKKYLEFAEYIVAQWETADGPQLIGKALTGVSVSQRFPHPKVWWSYENGQKAYEMMSCYDGLLDLYRITGHSEYLKAVELAAADIIKEEINVAGSGTAFECFYNGAKYQTEPTYHTMETCVTMTWMKLCLNLLKLTANPLYADQIEKAEFNALLASLKGDGSEIAKYSPLGGIRHAGEEQCGMHINCCNANGPRAFMMLPRFAVMKTPDGIAINSFGNIKSEISLSKNNILIVTQTSDYPVSGQTTITFAPQKEESYPVMIRIPAWSENTIVKINDQQVDNIKSGSYQIIKRMWHKGDRVTVDFDMRGRLLQLGPYQAILRGPVVLSRDTRFNDGFVYEAAVIKDKDGFVDLLPVAEKPDGVWMTFTAPMVLGTDLEGEFRLPKQVKMCDFGSAGNTWGEDSRYKVWLPKTLNVMNSEYKSY